MKMNTLVPPWNLQDWYVPVLGKFGNQKKGMHCSEIFKEHRVTWWWGQGSDGMW